MSEYDEQTSFLNETIKSFNDIKLNQIKFEYFNEELYLMKYDNNQLDWDIVTYDSLNNDYKSLLWFIQLKQFKQAKQMFISITIQLNQLSLILPNVLLYADLN